jgi:hypothetical protein
MRRAKRGMQIMATTGMLSSFLMLSGCDLLDPSTEISRIFRQAYVPGLLEGLSTAVTTPDNAEAGLRRTVTAFFEGLGAVLAPQNDGSNDN